MDNRNRNGFLSLFVYFTFENIYLRLSWSLNFVLFLSFVCLCLQAIKCERRLPFRERMVRGVWRFNCFNLLSFFMFFFLFSFWYCVNFLFLAFFCLFFFLSLVLWQILASFFFANSGLVFYIFSVCWRSTLDCRNGCWTYLYGTNKAVSIKMVSSSCCSWYWLFFWKIELSWCLWR